MQVFRQVAQLELLALLCLVLVRVRWALLRWLLLLWAGVLLVQALAGVPLVQALARLPLVLCRGTCQGPTCCNVGIACGPLRTQ